jgi:heptosyltransferase-3
LFNIRKEAPSFLIVCFRFIGDVLVTTPLALSIKTAIPDAYVDYLVFKGTDKALTKNPYIRNIIAVPRDESNIGTLLSLFQKYDVAIAAYPSDRTIIAAAIAGRCSIGLTYNIRMWWKRVVLSSAVQCDDDLHVVPNILSLLAPLSIPPVPDVVMGYDEDDLMFASNALGTNKYVLIHPYSIKQYKYWPAEQWGSLAAIIQKNSGCTVVFTATPSADDNAYLEEILAFAPADVLTFPCTLNQFAAALRSCAAYIGIDTAATHIAAALEVPTFALFGPTLTRYWAPWPNGCTETSPFAANKGVQRTGKVTVIQKDWPCVPCNGESCAISTRGKMECLEQLAPEEVFGELREVLGARSSRG